MTYQPRDFWERRLSEHFDLRGSGETGLSLAYNRACYALRRSVLDRALAEVGMDPSGKRVLDVGCGTGFFTEYYLKRGALVTGLDIASASIERLRARFPEARFTLADVSEASLGERYDVVNAFDVLYHITDEERWRAAVRNLAAAVAPGGVLLVTDLFSRLGRLAEHNQVRPLEVYRDLLSAAGLEIAGLHPTHVLLNRDLKALRFLNRLPWVLLAADRFLLGLGLRFEGDPVVNRLLVAVAAAR